jgi:hypothetical protein
MKQIYQFSTTLTPDGTLTVPESYLKLISTTHPLRVIVINESEPTDLPLSVTEFIASIINTPTSPPIFNLRVVY